MLFKMYTIQFSYHISITFFCLIQDTKSHNYKKPLCHVMLGDFLEHWTRPDQFSRMATALEQIFWCPEALAAPRSPDFGVADLYLNFIKQNRQIDFVVRKPVFRYKAGQRCEFVQFGEGIEIMSTLIPVFFQTQRIGQRS